VGSSAVGPSLAKLANGLRSLGHRLALIDRHDVLALLRVSLGHSRAIYELRAGAFYRTAAALSDYDQAPGP
jgi:hypothetical protein